MRVPLRMVTLKVPVEMYEKWLRSANKSCLTLSEWIRKKCEGQKVLEPVRWRQQK